MTQAQAYSRSISASGRWPPTCPCCGSDASRIERRRPDLLLSMLVPVRRYRCASARCGWHGNLRTY